MTLSCPTEGKPEPQIIWSKDGQILFPHNISRVVRSAEMIGNEIKIVRVKARPLIKFEINQFSRKIRDDSPVRLSTRLEPLNKTSSSTCRVGVLIDG